MDIQFAASKTNMKHLLTIISCFAVLSMSAQVPGYVNEQGLMAWYSMNGSSEDDSGNGNHLIADGEVIWAEFEGNEFCDFPGDGQFLYHPDNSWPSSTELSIALWVRMDEYSTGNSIGTIRPILSKHFSSSNGSFIFLSREDELVFAYGYEVPNPLSLNNWHHIAVCWRGSGSSQAYLDGELIFEGNDGLSLTDHPFFIGGWLECGYTSYENCGAGLTFDGGIYDLGIWNRPLLAEEVESLFQQMPLSLGCTEPSACNFNSDATYDDGSCDSFTCLCLDGTIWSEELGGCIPMETCEDDLDGDGVVGVNDLMQLLSSFGTDCSLVEPAEWTCGDPVSYHGYDYETVLIGEQCWFAEDLRATLFRNGEEIDFVENVSYEVQNSVLPVYAQNEIEGNGDFGNLYNLYSVIDERGLCPQQWSVSTPEHWEVLTSYIESNYTVLPGAALKSEIDWIGTPSIDLFGFNAKPGGYYGQGYCFYGHQANSLGIWWTAGTVDTATNFYLVAGDGALNSTPGACVPGFCASVRCVKD